jgi:DNA polymerase III epsilon subunit-like protein
MSRKTPTKYDLLFGIDVETTRIRFDPKTSQCIALAMIVVKNDANFTEVDRFYAECSFDSTRFVWEKEAQAIHGLSRRNLSIQPDMESAAKNLACFLHPYVNGNPITVIAHNPNFDVAYLKQWMDEAGYALPINHRMIDAFTAGIIAYDLHNSDEHFQFVGKNRGYHNAVTDIETSLEVIRKIRQAVGYIT